FRPKASVYKQLAPHPSRWLRCRRWRSADGVATARTTDPKADGSFGARLWLSHLKLNRTCNDRLPVDRHRADETLTGRLEFDITRSTRSSSDRATGRAPPASRPRRSDRRTPNLTMLSCSPDIRSRFGGIQ